MGTFHLSRGYDIPLAGEPESTVVDAAKPQTVAICPTDFLGLKVRPVADVGDKVKVGSPLVSNKEDDSHVFTSPVSGTVKEIRRGARRVITHVVIECDGGNDAVEFGSYDSAKIASLSRESVLEQVKASGMLAIFRERPFNFTARPSRPPRDIFVSTFDTGPLAPDLRVLVEGQEAAFQAGLEVCRRLTEGDVHVGVVGVGEPHPAFAKAQNVKIHQFSGAHPAGNVGVHIHHVAPVKGRNDVVWTLNVAGVLMLGRLFLTGKVDPSLIVAVTGTGASVRQHVRTVQGAPLSALLGGKVEAGELRYVSGGPLTGAKISADDYLRFYDLQVTVLPEATEAEFIGWMLPGGNKDSWFRVFLGKVMGGKRFTKDTRLAGGHRAMVWTGHYESVTPIDVLPGFLYKSIRAGDIEEMEGLGIYEVVEEDVALCEYICPSKTDFQATLRRGIDLIDKEG